MNIDFEPVECEHCWALVSPARVGEHMACHSTTVNVSPPGAIPLIGPPQAGLLLDTLLVLPRLNSGALRKIADDCEKLITGRMEDGVFE